MASPFYLAEMRYELEPRLFFASVVFHFLNAGTICICFELNNFLKAYFVLFLFRL